MASTTSTITKSLAEEKREGAGGGGEVRGRSRTSRDGTDESGGDQVRTLSRSCSLAPSLHANFFFPRQNYRVEIVWSNVIKFGLLHAVGLVGLACLPSAKVATLAFGLATYVLAALVSDGNIRTVSNLYM